MPLEAKFKVKIDPEKCKGCLLCIENCSRQVLEQSTKSNSKGYFSVQVKYQEKCIGCKNCAIICPDVAIEIYKK